MLGPELTFTGRTGVLFEGRQLTFFGGNDYHRLSSHPEVIAALTETAQQYGLSSAGSRWTTANHPLYGRLEATIAAFLGTEAAALCPTGYMSNAILLQAIANDYTLLFLEEKAHASLTEAATLSGLPIVRFRHREPEDLAHLCALHVKPGDRPIVLTDGVFPNTGDTAPLKEYAEIVSRHGGRIHVDDCHGLGVLGPAGRGSGVEAGVAQDSLLLAGTLSKAFGSFGGIIAGSKWLIDRVQSGGPGFVGGTPIPLPVAAAASRAIELLVSEPERITRLRARVLAFKTALRSLGFPVSNSASPICSVTYFDAARNARLNACLLAADIYPSFINYPGCPPGGHFRFTLSSEHTESEIERLLEAIRDCET